MPLVTSEAMLLAAQKGGYAVGAFNVENMEMAQAVIAAAEELQAPVMIQTTPSTVRYGSLALYRANVAALAKAAKVPVAMHLDHGNSFELAAQALREGYTSIMIDGSHEIFEENIALTQKVVAMCKPNQIPVEAELGKVGGKEDDLNGGAGGYTDPSEAKEFVKRTQVSSLAVAIGTAHGLYSKTPKIDFQRLAEIREVVDVPLVLHGASDVPDEFVRRTIELGVTKVNVATELKIAFAGAVKAWFAENPQGNDPRYYMRVGMDAMKEVVRNKINVCGSANRISA